MTHPILGNYFIYKIFYRTTAMKKVTHSDLEWSNPIVWLFQKGRRKQQIKQYLFKKSVHFVFYTRCSQSILF